MTSTHGPISVANIGSLTLPMLKTETRYNGMPRRYEETKPAVVQNFTHRYILGKTHGCNFLMNSFH